jgi:hypothetical protein
MLADDFRFLISLEAGRAGIPACDGSSRIEQVDGVVGYRLDEQAIASDVTP